MDRLINIALDVGYHRNMGGIHFLYDNYISYKTFKEFISVYEYDIECKYVTMISKILDKIFNYCLTRSFLIKKMLHYRLKEESFAQ